jgi:hypothetical protein
LWRRARRRHLRQAWPLVGRWHRRLRHLGRGCCDVHERLGDGVTLVGNASICVWVGHQAASSMSVWHAARR